MSQEQLISFLGRVQDDPSLRQQVQACSTADDVARLASGLGFDVSGDELLRASGKRIGKVRITKQDMPGEYN